MGDIGGFKFKKLDSIGAAAAEDDEQFLGSCFVDNGYLEHLLDCQDPRRIVVGRTGAGKSALLHQVTVADPRTIVVRPETLALEHISNSTIIRFVADLGVRLDVFFKLLWRHVLVVEILRQRFNITSEKAKMSFFQRIASSFSSENKQALKYLEQWGGSFWIEREHRILEVTKTLETELRGAAKGVVPGISFDAEGRRQLTEAQREAIVERAQSVINQVQMKQLSKIIGLIDDVLKDPQKPCYLTIDGLDEEWVDDDLRYRLIRALIETTREFRRVQNAKVIVAIRRDLLGRVIRETRDAGFQEEKYESLYIPIQWSMNELVDVMDKRVAHLVRRKYEKSSKVTHGDLFPAKVRRESFRNYLFPRLIPRPRDVILFVNKCVERADNKKRITGTIVQEAEGDYSRLRLRAIADEWHSEFPMLLKYSVILRNRRRSFDMSSVSSEEINDLAVALLEEADSDAQLDPVALACAENQSEEDIRKAIFLALYQVGIVGLKPEAHSTADWAEGGRALSIAEIVPATKVQVHGAFWRVFGITGKTN